MSLRSKNKLLIILIAILSAICLLFAGLGLYFHQTKKGENPKAADLSISTYSQLKDFANSVNSGNTYSGQKVVLSTNINCQDHIGGTEFNQALPCIGGGHRQISSGSTSYSFAGEFDGQGYTIYGFKLTGGYTYSTNKIVGQKLYDYYHDYYLGLFVNLTGVVKRLKVSDVEYSVTRQADHKTRPTYHTEHKSAIVCNRSSSGTLSECWSSVGAAYQGVSSVSNLMLPSSIINGSGGTISSANNTSGLSWSSTGGEGGTTWYYSSSYNSGWPKLRIFINTSCDWKEVTFSATGGSSPGSIWIPGDAYGTFSSTSTSIKIYDQTVSSTSSYCHYSSVTWTANSATSYSVTFTKPTRTITVKTQIGSAAASTFKTYTLACGGTISVSTTPYGSSSRYKSCTVGGYTYTPSADYYISSISHTNGTAIHADTTVTITVAKKSYNITFN